MFDQADQQLKAWIEQILPDVTFSLAAPQAQQEGSGVSFYLLGMSDRAISRNGVHTPIQITLRYLVSAWATEPETAHRLLGKLVLASIEHQEYEVELESMPMAIWTAFNLVPRPCFILAVPFRKEREIPPTKYVQVPLIVQTKSATGLYGRVVGPNSIPLSGTLVTIPSLQLFAYTDGNGCFHFPLVPETNNFISVKVKERELLVKVEAPTTESQPLQISFDAPEE